MTGQSNAQATLDFKDRVSFQTLGCGWVCTQHPSQLMPENPLVIPCTASRGKSSPMDTEGINILSPDSQDKSSLMSL